MADTVETINPFSEAWDAALRFVKKTGWVSERESPPVEGETVIVLIGLSSGNPSVSLGRRWSGMWYLSDGSRASHAHWIPFPDMPDLGRG